MEFLRQPVQFLDGVRTAEVVTGPVLFGLLFLEVVLNELAEQESSRRGGSGRRQLRADILVLGCIQSGKSAAKAEGRGQQAGS